MGKSPIFGQILEDAGRLSLEEQETLIQVIQRRLIDQRRKEIIQEMREAEREFKEGKATPVTADALMKEILS